MIELIFDCNMLRNNNEINTIKDGTERIRINNT